MRPILLAFYHARQCRWLPACNANGFTFSQLPTPLSLPLSIRLVPLRIAFDKIHAQQPPAGFQLGLGFDAVRNKFPEVDEAGKKFGHGRRSVKLIICGSIKKNRNFANWKILSGIF